MSPLTRSVAPRWIATAVLASTFALVLGCGGGKGDVTGTVKYKGEKLPYGNIQFISPAGAFVGEIGSDGTYTVTGIPVGTSKVSVNCQDPKYVDYMKALAAASKDPKAPKPSGHPDQFNKIPTKYFNYETSGLTLEVKTGSQTWDIDLK